MDLARRLKTVEDAENISPLQSEASQLSVFSIGKNLPAGFLFFFADGSMFLFGSVNSFQVSRGLSRHVLFRTYLQR